MLDFKNGVLSFDMHKCAQCGACLAVCPTGALKTCFIEKNGLTNIIPDHSLCTKCASCVNVCPSRRLPLSNKQLFPDDAKIFLANATNYSMRYNASSGGAVRTIARSCLEAGLVEQVYAVITSKQYPWAVGTLTASPQELDRAANSMYLPVLGARNLHQATGGSSILLIGLPCQLYGAKKLLGKKYKEIYTISIFCKQQKNLNASRHMARRLHKKFSFVGPPISFRGDGWPGMVSLDGNKIKWEREGALTFKQRLWRVPACKLCNMPFGDNTDISVADPWSIDEENAGRSLVFIRSAKGQNMFDTAARLMESTELNDKSKAKLSVDLPGIYRKHMLAMAYAGKNVPFCSWLAMQAEKVQIRILEFALGAVTLPEILYRCAGKCPDISKLIFMCDHKSKRDAPK